jgi:hypothetical protein
MPIVMGLDEAGPVVDPALDVALDAAEPQAATAVRVRAAPRARTGSLS